MAIRDLIPWGRQETRAPTLYREPELSPINWFRREVDRMFDDWTRDLGGWGSLQRAAWPHVEVKDTGNEVKVMAEVPGLEESDLDVTSEDGVLAIRGERKDERQDKDRGYSELYYGRFERHIPLPNGADHEKATARFENGVLTVTMPKSAEAERGRRIPINGQTRH